MKNQLLTACIFSVALCIGMTACKQNGTGQTENQDTTGTTAPATQNPGQVTLGDDLSKTNQPAGGGLGSIQIEAMRELWESSDAVDIIFYETNFSLSQTEKAAIQQTLGYFLPMPIAHNTSCKPIGRIAFLIQGEIRREADIYIHEGCQYFLWMEKEKPVYINPMSPQGVAFFDGILKKGQDQFKKQ